MKRNLLFLLLSVLQSHKCIRSGKQVHHRHYQTMQWWPLYKSQIADKVVEIFKVWFLSMRVSLSKRLATSDLSLILQFVFFTFKISIEGLHALHTTCKDCSELVFWLVSQSHEFLYCLIFLFLLLGCCLLEWLEGYYHHQQQHYHNNIHIMSWHVNGWNCEDGRRNQNTSELVMSLKNKFVNRINRRCQLTTNKRFVSWQLVWPFSCISLFFFWWSTFDFSCLPFRNLCTPGCECDVKRSTVCKLTF